MDTQLFDRIKNPNIKNLLVEVADRGYILRAHAKDENMINVYSPIKGKNVIGDVRILSDLGSFRLEDKGSGKWYAYTKFGICIQDAEFVQNVLSYIEN